MMNNHGCDGDDTNDFAVRNSSSSSSSSSSSMRSSTSIGDGSMRVEKGNDKEIILRYVFLRCDPILHQLCDLVQTRLLPALSSSSSLYGTSSHSNMTVPVLVLRQIADQLAALQERLLSLLTGGKTTAAPHPTSATAPTGTDDDRQAALLLLQMKQEAIVTMLDYIMVPVITVVRTLGNEKYCWRKPPQQQQPQPQQRHDQILQSMVWKCIIHSGSIVTLIVKTCFIPSTINATSTSSTRTAVARDATRKKRLLVSYLHAAILALPSSPVIKRQWFEGTMAMTSQLDRGDDCATHVVTTLHVLIQAITTTTTTPSTTSSTTTAPTPSRHNHHSDNDDNTLTYHNIPNLCLIRILDSCIMFIEPPHDPTSSSSSSSSSHDDRTPNHRSRSEVSAELQLVAIELVDSLLNLPQPPMQLQPQSPRKQPLAVTDTEFDWCSAFPGVYSGVYRRILHFLQRQSQPPPEHRHHATTTNVQNITWHCIRIVTNLLLACCGRGPNSKSVNNAVDAASQQSVMILDKLQSLAMAANASSLSSTTTSTGKMPSTDETNSNSKCNASTPQGEFLKQVQQRIPSTLFILVNGFGRVRSTPKIRQQLIQLSRVILMDTYHCWMIEQNRYLLVSSLEMVLLFVNDTDSTVASNAKTFVMEYLTEYLHNFHTEENHPHSDHWEYRHTMKCRIGPRILELMERLQSCVQSGRDDEVQSSLQRIVGYLQYLPQKFLRSALTSESIQHMIRRTFRDLFDVPFEISDPYEFGTIVLNFIHHPNRSDNKSTNRIRTTPDQFTKRQYMSESMIELTKVVVQTYGSVIGPKLGMTLIDACIADLYRSCVDRIERGMSMTGRSQIQWLHEWIGMITFVHCILLGSFHSRAEDSTSKSRGKHRTKYLVPLLRSCLPIITTYPLWDLGNHWNVTNESEKSRSEDNFGISAFRGNVVMMCSLLEFMKEAIGLLDSDSIQIFNSILLYPILDKMSEQYPGAIRETAYHTIDALATANQCDGIVSLIVNNIESCLIGPMLSRLRIPGGRSLQPDTPVDYDIACVLDCATIVLRLATDAYGNATSVESKPTPAPNILMSMEDLTTQLTTRFDYASTIVTYDVVTCLKYLQLFDTVVGLLQVVYRPQFKSSESVNVDDTQKIQALSSSSSSPPIDVDSEPWFQLLAPYTQENDDDKLSPKEGFGKYWKEKEDMRSMADALAHSKTMHYTEGINFQRDIKFCSYIVWRLGYMLSHGNLQVQHRSCDVLVRCFQWLGFIGTINQSGNSRTATNDDHATPSSNHNPKNAVLRQVHSVWPTISARMKALCTAVVTDSDSVRRQPLSLIVVKSKHPSDSAPTNEQGAKLRQSGVGEQRLYLCKILQLITVMIENTEDFMYSRFRNEIYPNCILKLLQHYLNRITGTCHIRKNTPSISFVSRSLQHQNQQQRRTPFTESDETLLYEVFDCIRRLYMYRPMGQQACTGHLTAAIGQHVLAVICHGNQIENLYTSPKSRERIRQIGTDVLREMIHVDTDALYRPIFQFVVSDQSCGPSNMVPHCPLLPIQRNTDSPENGGPEANVSTSTHATRPNTIVVPTTRNAKHPETDVFVITAMKELLDLMTTLPEQPIY